MFLDVCLLLLSVLVSICAELSLRSLESALGLKAVNEIDVELVERVDSWRDSITLEK